MAARGGAEVNKYGIHLANGGEMDLERVVSLGCSHYLALEGQAEALAQCPGARYLRLWDKGFLHRPAAETAANINAWAARGDWDLIPWNEANLASELDDPPAAPEVYRAVAARYCELLPLVADSSRLHFPAWSPSGGYREALPLWREAAMAAPVVDVHAYGSASEMFEIVEWYLAALPGKRLLVTEYNPGGGRWFDPAWWAQEAVTFVRCLYSRPLVLGAVGFIWRWHNPDMYLPQTLDWRDQPIEAAMRAAYKANVEETPMPAKIAVALCPSNQDRNISPVNPAYNEAGGMAWISPLIEAACAKLGILAKWIPATLESKDAYHLAGLRTQQRAANAWLDEQDAALKILVSYHTDSGTASHTFGIYASSTGPDAAAIAGAIAQEVSRAMLTQSVEVFERRGDIDFNTYVFAQAARYPAVLIELCSHQSAKDMAMLFSQPATCAEAIARGIARWAGLPVVAPAPTVDKAEARRAALLEIAARATAAANA